MPYTFGISLPAADSRVGCVHLPVSVSVTDLTRIAAYLVENGVYLAYSEVPPVDTRVQPEYVSHPAHP